MTDKPTFFRRKYYQLIPRSVSWLGDCYPSNVGISAGLNLDGGVTERWCFLDPDLRNYHTAELQIDRKNSYAGITNLLGREI